MEREHERKRQANLDDVRERLDKDSEEGQDPDLDPDRTPMARVASLARTDSDLTSGEGEMTPKNHRGSLAAETIMDTRLSDTASEVPEAEANNSSALRRYLEGQMDDIDQADINERTTLLPGRPSKKGPGVFTRATQSIRDIRQRAGEVTPREMVKACIEEPVKTLPSVILGCLLNVLDGVSYGMIL